MEKAGGLSTAPAVTEQENDVLTTQVLFGDRATQNEEDDGGVARRVSVDQSHGLGEEEEVCGVCLERPAPGCFVELWCCGNVLCVDDAQQLGKCPFCRQEPLPWNIAK